MNQMLLKMWYVYTCFFCVPKKMVCGKKTVVTNNQLQGRPKCATFHGQAETVLDLITLLQENGPEAEECSATLLAANVDLETYKQVMLF